MSYRPPATVCSAKSLVVSLALAAILGMAVNGCAAEVIDAPVVVTELAQTPELTLQAIPISQQIAMLVSASASGGAAAIAALTASGLIVPAVVVGVGILVVGALYYAIVHAPSGVFNPDYVEDRVVDVMINGYLQAVPLNNVRPATASNTIAATGTMTMRCSPTVNARLQQLKHDACDVNRSCMGGRGAGLACGDFEDLIAAGQSCLDARQKHSMVCYGGFDQAHWDEFLQAQEVLQTCFDEACRYPVLNPLQGYTPCGLCGPIPVAAPNPLPQCAQLVTQAGFASGVNAGGQPHTLTACLWDESERDRRISEEGWTDVQAATGQYSGDCPYCLAISSCGKLADRVSTALVVRECLDGTTHGEGIARARTGAGWTDVHAATGQRSFDCTFCVADYACANGVPRGLHACDPSRGDIYYKCTNPGPPGSRSEGADCPNCMWTTQSDTPNFCP